VKNISDAADATGISQFCDILYLALPRTQHEPEADVALSIRSPLDPAANYGNHRTVMRLRGQFRVIDPARAVADTIAIAHTRTHSDTHARTAIG
jgi:hypothetical protein